MTDRERLAQRNSVSAVLLAAGESTRMGTLKALLPWQGQPLIAYQVEQLLDSGIERVVVVLGHRAEEVGAHLPDAGRLHLVVNPLYQSGKVSSIIAGVVALPPADHCLILGVDQPRSSATIRRVVDCHHRAEATVTVAAYRGRRGHPVVFAPQLRPELLTLSEATQGLRAVLQRHASEVRLCETNDPLTLVNLNTPEDYQQARKLA